MNPVCALMFYKNPNVLTKQQRDDVELCPVIEALQRDVKEDPKCGSQHLLYQIWKQLNFSSDGVLTRTFAHKNSAMCSSHSCVVTIRAS